MKLKIANKEFTVKVAKTDKHRVQGLRGIKAIPDDFGVVLKYDKEVDVPITMSGMNFPIDILFLKNGEVVKKTVGELGDTEIQCGCSFDAVFESNKGTTDGIMIGDPITWIGEKREDGTIELAEGGIAANPGEMQVLDENGKAQMNLKGSERIFSRIHTRKLIELATKADETKDDKDYLKLGKALTKMVIKQDTQEQEYAEN